MNTEVPSCGGRIVCISSIGGAEVHLKRPLEFFKGAADGSVLENWFIYILDEQGICLFLFVECEN